MMELDIRIGIEQDRNHADLLACSIASGGACGEPGEVIMLMADGRSYSFNWIKSNVLPEDVRRFAAESGLRGFLYLGLGNALYLREEDIDWLQEKRDRYMHTSDESLAAFPTATLYKKWEDFYREHLTEGI